jgi:hypothetical protein
VSLINAGTFRAKVTNTFGYENAFGNKLRARVTLELKTGPDAGRTIDFSGPMEGKGLQYTIKSLAAMGAADGEPTSVKPGTEVDVVIEQRKSERNGRTYAEVKFVNPVRLPNFKPDAAKLAELRRNIAAINGTPVAEPVAFDPSAFDGASDQPGDAAEPASGTYADAEDPFA